MASLDDMLEALSVAPKPRRETILMNEANWTRAKGIFHKDERTSLFHLASIPFRIVSWATQIYIVPDDVLAMAVDFEKKFGGPSADNLLQHLAELTKRHGEEEED